jgi:hypothetical protein
MCWVCEMWESGAVSSEEAMQIAGEVMKMEDIHHLMELTNKILEKEVPLVKRDEDMEETWYNEFYRGEA